MEDDDGERVAFSFLVDSLHVLPAPAIVAVDGWSGSGKTWTASHLVVRLGALGIGWTVLHMDDFVPGWNGLREGVDLVREHVVEPLAAGRVARVRQWDWHRSRPGQELEFRPTDGVILEGSGAIAAARDLTSLAVWIDVEESCRMERLRGRSDYEAYEPYIDNWAVQERDVAREFDSVGRADLVVTDVGRESLVRQRGAENSSY